MMSWLASYTFTSTVIAFGLAMVAVGLDELFSGYFHRAFDTKFRSAIMKKTTAWTDREVRGFYHRALWSRKELREPISSVQLRAAAPRFVVIWSKTYRVLAWTTMTFFVFSLTPLVIEQLDIMDLHLGFYGPTRYRGHSRYNLILDPVFAYLRYVIHGPFSVLIPNALFAITGLAYWLLPPVRTRMNALIARAKLKLGL